MALQPAGGHGGAGRLLQGPAQDFSLRSPGDHQQEGLGRQDLRRPQGDGLIRDIVRVPAKGVGVLLPGRSTQGQGTAGHLGTTRGFVEPHMAVAAQTQQLQTQAAGALEVRAIAKCLHLGVQCLAIGNPQRTPGKLQRCPQLDLHEGRKGAGVLRPETNVFIEVEAAPIRQERLPLLRRQLTQQPDQRAVDGQHRAPGGQAEVAPRAQGLQQPTGDELRHGAGIGGQRQVDQLGSHNRGAIACHASGFEPG